MLSKFNLFCITAKVSASTDFHSRGLWARRVDRRWGGRYFWVCHGSSGTWQTLWFWESIGNNFNLNFKIIILNQLLHIVMDYSKHELQLLNTDNLNFIYRLRRLRLSIRGLKIRRRLHSSEPRSPRSRNAISAPKPRRRSWIGVLRSLWSNTAGFRLLVVLEESDFRYDLICFAMDMYIWRVWGFDTFWCFGCWFGCDFWDVDVVVWILLDWTFCWMLMLDGLCCLYWFVLCILISIYAYYLDLLLWLIICEICCCICARNWAFMRYTMLEVAGSMHCWFCKKNTQISNVHQRFTGTFIPTSYNVLHRIFQRLPTSFQRLFGQHLLPRGQPERWKTLVYGRWVRW